MGMRRMMSGSRVTNVPSSSGFMSAGSAGSLAATTTMPSIDTANARQYGRT